MNSQPLQLRHGKAPLRPATAWLVPGAGPSAWLEEVLRWGVPHTALVLRVLPHGRSDLRPRGVLVTAGAGAEPKVSRRCLAYGRLAGRLFLPVEARLDPDVSEAELAALLGPGEYVWHPSAGLVGFEPADLLRLADLLRGTVASGRTWDRAAAGVTFARRLTFLAPEEVPTVETLLRQGRGDIGDSSGRLEDLPPDPDEEPQGGSLRKALGRFGRWLTGKARTDLEERRRRELQRLMRLLEKDPDQGLRFAMPMAGKAHRGLAPPSDRLGSRDVSFDLGRLGGGGPADFWEVPADYHHHLVARYRELADREVRLGRHRRAAYIYAELLGDFTAAATALAAGGHWREAAVLYREKLQQPGEAARCLERGGLWAEAVALYEELKEFEKAGDLCTRLEQFEEAAALYSQAVARHRACGDFLAAARLLDDKLKDTDAALAELAAGWPASAQAGECLRGVFRMLGRLGRHDEAQARLDGCVRQGAPTGKETSLVDILAETATGYPDRGVQAVAADGTRVLAARLLRAANQTDARRLVDAVARLEPHDRLLRRDCQRYAEQRPLSYRPVVGLGGRRNSLVLVGRLELARDVAWKAATWSGDTIFAAGFRGAEVVIVRCRPEGVVQESDRCPEFGVGPGLRDPAILLAVQHLDITRLLVYVPGTVPRGARWTFPRTDVFPRTVCTNGPAGLSPNTLAAVGMPSGIVWLLDVRNDMLTLVALGMDDEPLTTRALAPMSEWHCSDLDSWPLPWPLHVRDEQFFVGFGDRLLLSTLASHKLEVVEVVRGIRGLCGSAPGTRPRLAITCEEGGLLRRIDVYADAPLEPFGAGLSRPVANFTAAGDLVAAGPEGCEVYATHDRPLKLRAGLDSLPARPLAVLPLPKPDQFALFLETGAIAVYQVPSG